jgi:two-component system, LuxR family, sensor kinase FixL
MTRKKVTDDALKGSTSLRERAEALLRAQVTDQLTMPIGDVQALVHELSVYQVELELQNEELRQAQVELAQSRDRYSGLYEFAPVGYLTLNKDGTILEANLMAAKMLGVDRQELVQANLTKFVARKSQDEFYRHRQAFIADELKHICELEMHHADGHSRIMLLESVASGTDANHQIRTALVDITDRKQFERQLAEQERFNRATLDALSAHVAVIDATGVILTANQAWRDFAETNRTSWQSASEGANYLSVCDRASAGGDTDAALAAQAIRQVIAGQQETWVHEYPCHSADAQRWFYCRVTRFPGPGTVKVVVAHENITALHQMQEQLAVVNSRFETLSRVSPVGIMFFDSTGQCVDVNARWCEMAGMGRLESLGDNWYSAVHPDDRPRLSHEWSQAVEDGAVYHSEFRFLRPDGAILWLVCQGVPLRDANGVISGFIRAALDVTVLKQTERDLKVSREQLSTLLKTAADAIITIDESGNIQSANRASERMFGYAAAELIGQNVRILMPAPYHKEHDDYLKRYVETGVKRVIGIGREATGLRKNGTTFPLDLSVSEVEHLNIFMGVLRDISQRKQLERRVVEIASLEQQRIGQDLHDSVGQQLTGMILLTQRLAESARNSERQEIQSKPPRRAMSSPKLSDQAERLRVGLEETLQDIRTICRELTPVPINSDGLMAALGQLVAQVSSRSSVTCHFRCPVSIAFLDNVTATHLYNIANGALSNALRHAQARAIEVRLEQTDKQLTLSVRDDGIGLPPLRLAGLGLRIMQNRAQIIGGTFAIRSVQPTGTEVTCTVAIGKDPPGEIVPPPTLPEPR